MDETRRSAADRTALSTARDRIAEAVEPIDRTEALPVSTAVGRPLAEPVTARRPVPRSDRVARDGFAVRGADVADATESDPVTLAVGETVGDGTAVRVDAGDPVPDEADTVVGLDGTASPRAGPGTVSGGEIAVSRPLDPGAGVRPTGSDVAADETVRPAGHQLAPSDPALCTAVGRTRVEVRQRPTVGVLPAGDGLASGDPGPDATVETNGTTVSEVVERRGGKVTYRDPVSTDPYALRAAVQRDLTRDLLVTVGTTGAGESDRIREAVADLGAVQVDGVALEPGATTALSVVRERPVLSLPGDPVAAFVATTQFVAPAVARLAGRDPPAPVLVDADLAAAVDSEPGLTSMVPVEIDREESGGAPSARPVDDGPLSTLARADGWVAVPGDRERLPAGETVSVERWEASL